MARSGQRFGVYSSAYRTSRRRLQLERLEDRLALATLPTNFSEANVASGLSSATAMEISPDGKLFVAEQAGTMEVWQNNSRLQANFFANTPLALYNSSTDTGLIDNNGERGLLGVTFDPNFATNRFVYVYYTYAVNPDGNTGTPTTFRNRVVRFTANAAGDLAVAGSAQVIMELDNLSGATNHNGGAIHFGPDGLLYIAVGENANTANSQTLANRHGKILRIDLSGDDFTNPSVPGDAGQNYRIPAGNPTTIPGTTGTATGYNRSIWAAGLRNPFTFTFQPGTGLMHINDVGGGSWEEINIGAAGANYGWPNTEGDFNQSSFPNYTRPFYAYAHGGGAFNGFAITGGAFYNPSNPGINQFPTQYAGDYFFADYVSDWINVIDLNTRQVTTFASGASGAVDLRVASDGSLYYLARDQAVVRRVIYTANQAPSITQHPQNQSALVGGAATFTASATGSTPLGFQWQRAESGTSNWGNIAGATNSSYTLTSAQTSDNGDQFRVVVTNTFGTQTSNAATLAVSSNQAPTATITINSGLRNGRFDAGQQIAFSGTASDPEDGTLGASAFTWQVDYITSIDSGDPAVRPFVPAFSGQTSGTFTPATTGPYLLTDVAYRISLTVTDSAGTSRTFTTDVLPNTATLTVTTDPAGLQVTVDGQPFTAPRTFASVVGFERPIGAPATQSSGGTTYNFVSWRHGGAATQTLITPAGNTTYTATYAAAPAPVIRVLDNGSPGFATVGNWQLWSQSGYAGDYHYMTSVNSSGAATATWDFGSVTPGLYRVSATWTVSTNRPSNAPYTVFDGAAAEATVPLDQRVAPNDFTADGGSWENLGVFQIDTGALRVVLTNAANQPNVIADAIRIERIGDLPAPAPEISVLAGATNLSDGGAFSFGNVALGSPQTQIFTVRNDGSQNLTLGSFDPMPSGFTLTQGFGQTTLTPGQTTTFSIRADATATGTFSGVVRFVNNDGNENPFDFTISATVAVAPVIRVLDNGSPGFATVGNWQLYGQSGYAGDYHYITSVNASGAATATWDFGSVTPGMYRVSATWTVSTNRPSNAPFTVFDGAAAEATVPLDQRVAPNDFTADGGSWENLGVFQIDSGALRVVLTNAANQPNVIADAIRIERIGDLPAPAPEISVLAGATNLSDGGAFSFGNVALGSPQTQIFTVRNDGSQNLTLGSFDPMPSGFTLTQGFGQTTLTPGQTTTFSIRADATATGTFSGVVRFVNNDGNENPFDFTISATVAVAPVIRVLDNGSPGFATVGNWQLYGQSGYAGDYHYITSVNASGAATATWDFGSVTPGMYRVSATWTVSTNRPSNAPFTVFDGAAAEATVPLDQRVAPNDFTADGGSWENLGVFQIDSGALRVVLTNAANQPNVIADAIRIERIGDLPSGAAFAALAGEVDDTSTPAAISMRSASDSATTTADAPSTNDLALATFLADAASGRSDPAIATPNQRRWQALDVDRLFALLANDDWDPI